MNPSSGDANLVIAIDGPGGVGKSTVSRAVAARLGLPYLDTGATYRAATLLTLRAGVDVEDARAIEELLDRTRIGYETGTILLDGEDVAGAVRSDAVTRSVSAVSAHPTVRSRIVGTQRAWVADHGGSAVVEGRDIGTVVFPDAPVKVFLTARPEVRAQRRAGDAESEGSSVAEIAEDLARRDSADSSRPASPMRAADDAVVVDTSDASIEDVVAEILALVADVGAVRRPGD